MPNTHMQMGSVKPSDCIGDGETATMGKGRTPHVIGVAKANTCGRIGGLRRRASQRRYRLRSRGIGRAAAPRRPSCYQRPS